MLYIIGLIAVGVMLLLQYLTKNRTSSFVTRLISGVILVLAALLTVCSGGWILYTTTLVLSLIGMAELFRATGLRTEMRPGKPEWFGYLGCIIYYVFIGFLPGKAGWLGIPAALIVILGIYVFSFPEYHIDDIMKLIFAMLYVGVLLSCVFLIRELSSGRFVVWLVFLSAWGSDTCAYCAGMLWGKHKMTPVLSPKKTIEGAGGGVVGAVILGMLYGIFTTRQTGAYMLICLGGAVVSMIGDLAASAIKRQKGIKDFGNLIPGHGGILDRFDSVIFTAPAVYLLAVLLVN